MVRPAQVQPRLGPEERGIPISTTRWGYESETKLWETRTTREITHLQGEGKVLSVNSD
jgi:hypothetical protein